MPTSRNLIVRPRLLDFDVITGLPEALRTGFPWAQAQASEIAEFVVDLFGENRAFFRATQTSRLRSCVSTPISTCRRRPSSNYSETGWLPDRRPF